jgi:hypothetical protein
VPFVWEWFTLTGLEMRYIALALLGSAAAAPAPQFDLGALLGSLGGGAKDGAGGAGGLADILGGLLGGAGAAGGAPGGGLGDLLGGLLGGAGAAGGAPGGGGLGDILGGLLGNGGGPAGDVSVITGEYEKIKGIVVAQDEFVSKIGDKPPADLIAQLDKFAGQQVAALKAATKAIDGMAGAVDILSAASMQAPGAEVTAATEKSIENLSKNVASISKIAGAKEAELKNLNAMLEATKEFNEAVNKKLPSLAQSVASTEAQKSVDALTAAIVAFGGKAA